MEKENQTKNAPQRVEVEIFGDTYRLRTDSDPDYIRQVAQMVDTQMKTTAQKTRTFGGNRLGVLTALEFADKYCQLKKDYDELMELFEDK